ncbi:P-loop containing nucleoside triphosphate hydrolase protein [Baffinella frigidus]|nr:P-loop containing nucleoside triphosphate hydrolase protein [Cryptophyta sp. CCMP2293]
MPPPGDAVAVQVALRVRPLVPSEIEQGCVACLGVTPGEPQVVVGGEKAFTFDHVFSAATPQEDVYTNAVQPLLEAFFAGFNTTVFAYGQTGTNHAGE